MRLPERQENPEINPLFTNELDGFMGFGCYVELKCSNVLTRINETDKWKLSDMCLPTSLSKPIFFLSKIC